MIFHGRPCEGTRESLTWLLLKTDHSWRKCTHCSGQSELCDHRSGFPLLKAEGTFIEVFAE
jgi:hypothetical protein